MAPLPFEIEGLSAEAKELDFATKGLKAVATTVLGITMGCSDSTSSRAASAAPKDPVAKEVEAALRSAQAKSSRPRGAMKDLQDALFFDLERPNLACWEKVALKELEEELERNVALNRELSSVVAKDEHFRMHHGGPWVDKLVAPESDEDIPPLEPALNDAFAPLAATEDQLQLESLGEQPVQLGQKASEAQLGGARDAAERRDPKDFKRGDIVIIKGLQSRSDLNGSECQLLHYAPVSGRWHGRLRTGESLRIRCCNIEPAPQDRKAKGCWSAGGLSQARFGTKDTRAARLGKKMTFIEVVKHALYVDEFAGIRAASRLKLASRTCWRAIRLCKHLYVGAGFDGSAQLGAVEALDLRTGRWRTTAPMRHQRHSACAAALDGFLYVCGGCDDQALQTVERYDPFRGHWEKMPSMLRQRYAGSAITHRGRLYVIGGVSTAKALSDMESFDPRTKKWIAEPPMRQARFLTATLIFRGQILVIGGCDACKYPLVLSVLYSTPSISSVECFNPEIREWKAGPDMCKGRCSVAMAHVKEVIYVCGGYDGAMPLDSAECFLSKDEKWHLLPPMLQRRSKGTAVVDAVGRIYVLGGHDGNSALDTVERWDPRHYAWERVPSMACGRAAPIAASEFGHIYVCGGNDGHGALSTAERFNPKTHSWEGLPQMTTKRSDMFGVVLRV